MVYTNKNSNDFVVTCKCSCGEALEFRFDHDEEYVWISVMVGGWYANQDSFFLRLKEKWKRIWTILRGKEYCYSEILMTKEDYEQFRTAVNKCP